MAGLGAAELVEAWTPRERRPAHARLAPLLAAAAGAEPIAGDTLGRRNQRLLAFHAEQVGGTLEAQVACAACGAQNEFVVPAEAILACPAPPATVAVDDARFRLPTMADLAELDDAGPGSASEVLIRHCRLSGGEARADAVARAFEAADPAAAVEVEVVCADCGAVHLASVDVAVFVAAALDRLVEGYLRDVDRLARAYGWSEREILALPPHRRKLYVELSAGAAEGRPRLVSRSG